MIFRLYFEFNIYNGFLTWISLGIQHLLTNTTAHRATGEGNRKVEILPSPGKPQQNLAQQPQQHCQSFWPAICKSIIAMFITSCKTYLWKWVTLGKLSEHKCHKKSLKVNLDYIEFKKKQRFDDPPSHLKRQNLDHIQAKFQSFEFGGNPESLTFWNIFGFQGLP